MALCKASSSINRLEHASSLVMQLSQYLPESHSQLFRPSPFLHNVKPSPWEALTFNIVSALLSLGLEYPSLHEKVSITVNRYLDNCAEAINVALPLLNHGSGTEKHGAVQESVGVLSIAVSLVGFLEASAMYTPFWNATKQLQVLQQLRSILSEGFMIAVETASSTVRNASDHGLRDWRKYTRRYSADGRPLGAMLLQAGLMQFVKACATSLVGAQNCSDTELLDDYMNGVGIARSHDEAEVKLLDCVTEAIADQIQLLDDGSDYLQLSSPLQQKLAFSVKAYAFIGYLQCVILSGNTTNSEDFQGWLEDVLMDPNQMACLELANATLKSIAIVAKMSLSGAASGSRSLLRYIVEGGVCSRSSSSVSAKCLAQVLGILSQDAVITTLYSLGNVLSPGSGSENIYNGQLVTDASGHGNATPPSSHERSGSIASFTVDDDESKVPYRSVVHAIVTIATSCRDEKISALAQSMLLQKIGKVNAAVDAYIIKETASLSISTGQAEFQLLLKFYDRVYWDGVIKGHGNITRAVESAMAYLSVSLKKDSPLYRVYLVHLLESIVNKGDATDLEKERQKDIVLAPDDIVPLLKPLALLVSSDKAAGAREVAVDCDQAVSSLFRDAWFNLAIHGMSLSSAVVQKHHNVLRLLAIHSSPLVSEDRMEMLESDVELNTILRRGMGPQRLLEQKRMLISEVPSRESDIKRLNYPKAVFLNAVLLIECLRASSGHCTKILDYFRDPALTTVEMASCMSEIAEKIISNYLALTLSGKHEVFSVPFLSKELAGFFVACCHRIERVQNVAVVCANKVINECPSALCAKHSLFALLELLTVMWNSCLEEDIDEFEWKPSFTSPMGIVTVDLPDNYVFRRKTLDVFLERATAWVTAVMNIAPLDIKGLLQVRT